MADRPARGLQWFLVQLSGGGPAARLARGAGTAFAASAAGTLIVFANQALLARVLGADAYGRYIYAVTWVGLLVIFSNAGLGSAAVRFVSEYSAMNRFALLRGFLRRSAQVVLLLSLLSATILAVVVAVLRPRIGDELARAFWVGCLLVPIWSLLELRSASLRGFKRILAAQGPPQVLRPVLFAAGIIGLYFLRSEGVSAPMAVVANTVATVVSLGLVELLLDRSLGQQRHVQTDVLPREWLAVSLPLLLMAGFGVILRSTDTLMLGFLKGTTDAGVYTVASRAAAFVPFMLTAVNTIAAPMIAEYYATGDRRRLQRTLKVGAWAVFVFATFVGVALTVAGGQLLGVFGQEFTAGYKPMLVLMGGQILNCLAGSVGYLLTMTGHQNQATVILGGGAGLNIILNALLIPAFGTLGAAMATATSMIAWNLGMLWAVAKHLGVNPTIFQARL